MDDLKTNIIVGIILLVLSILIFALARACHDNTRKKSINYMQSLEATISDMEYFTELKEAYNEAFFINGEGNISVSHASYNNYLITIDNIDLSHEMGDLIKDAKKRIDIISLRVINMIGERLKSVESIRIAVYWKDSYGKTAKYVVSIPSSDIIHRYLGSRSLSRIVKSEIVVIEDSATGKRMHHRRK